MILGCWGADNGHDVVFSGSSLDPYILSILKEIMVLLKLQEKKSTRTLEFHTFLKK